jgi:hypothetical protein
LKTHTTTVQTLHRTSVPCTVQSSSRDRA